MVFHMVTLKSTKEYASDVKLLQVKAKKESIQYKVEQFIEKKLKPEIVAEIKRYLKDLLDGKTDNNLFTMVQVPFYYYSHKEQFLKICQDIMKPLGYNVSESHDGAGMYATIAVDWKMPSV